MFKSRGVQGINLNPMVVFTVFLASPFEFFVNFIIFIPLGAFLWKYIKTLSSTIKVGLALIVTLEVDQYLFKLGITDISDVLINLSGLILGYLTIEWLADSGWVAEEKEKYIVLVKKN
jgi:glycopeptide antibiotics resistance protein